MLSYNGIIPGHVSYHAILTSCHSVLVTLSRISGCHVHDLYTNPTHNDNDVTFGNRIGGKSNPVVVQFQRWQVHSTGTGYKEIIRGRACPVGN